MLALDKAVRKIYLQFSFSSPGAIPAGLVQRTEESAEGRAARKARAGTGALVIEPTTNVSLREFVVDLRASGYELVDAFYQERADPKDTKGVRRYYMVRFLFVPREDVRSSDEFRGAREDILDELDEVISRAFWRVRAFLNPLYVEGEEVPSARSIAVNLEVRVPRFRPDGEPVTAWQKDSEGNRVGVAPLPIKPDFRLRVEQGQVQLVPTAVSSVREGLGTAKQ